MRAYAVWVSETMLQQVGGWWHTEMELVCSNFGRCCFCVLEDPGCHGNRVLQQVDE